MNKIMARLSDAHENWVASIVFIMNILRAMADIFWQIFKERFCCLYFQIKHVKNQTVKPCLYFVT